MIFDGRIIHAILDAEIQQLVDDHLSERQHLEFKVTVNLKDDKDKLEILHDIASLANGGGGYLFIGIRDDGKGRAQKFEPTLIGDVESIKKSIAMLCLDHIVERIDGLEFVARTVNGNPLLIARVPVSDKTPHMVKFLNRTSFYTRYDDGKREMTFPDIKRAFTDDSLSLQLSNLNANMATLLRLQNELHGAANDSAIIKKISTAPQSILEIKQGENLINAAHELFQKEIGGKPFFWIAACPAHPAPRLIDISSVEIREIIQKAPGSTANGWNMESSHPIKRTGFGLQRGDINFEILRLHENGLMEFYTPLSNHFCWKQSDEEFKKNPQLFPYPAVEYPTTFLRLYKALIEKAKIKDEILIKLSYINLKGYTMRPFPPGSIGFEIGTRPIIPYPAKDLSIPLRKVDESFSPDKVAYQDLIVPFYGSFHYELDTIPFYDRAKEAFNFPRN